MATLRDRIGREIDALDWDTLRSDLTYRIVHDEFVVPTPLHVRTWWEGVDSPAGCLYSVAASRLLPDGSWSEWVTFAEVTKGEVVALDVHARVVASIREEPGQTAWLCGTWHRERAAAGTIP